MTHILRDNRWMSFDDVISEAAERFRDMSSHNVDRGVWVNWASQACRQFARQAQCVKGVHKVPLVMGQDLYRLPDDCLRPAMVRIVYPGEDERRLEPDSIEYFKDGVATQQGLPDTYYQTRDRLFIGLDPAPSKGGFIGYASANGNVGGTTVVGPTSMSPVDDSYNGLTIRILDGARQGAMSVVTDYDGVTRTITVAPAFAGQILAGVRFEVHPDSLIVDYIKDGNAFTILPITEYQVKAGTLLNYEGFALNLPVRPENWWAGCEVRFTSGALNDLKTRIVSSSVNVSSAWTQLVVYPEVPIIPLVDDKVRVTDVPSIPAPFHSNLVDYCVAMAMVRRGIQGAGDLLTLFAKGVADCIAADQPPDSDKFEQMDTTDVEEDLD